MNGLEPLLIVSLVFALRDGVLAWWLIHKLLGNTPVSSPVPKPSPEPVAPEPKPSVSTAKPAPRFTGIDATSFAGANDSISSRISAYDGKVIDGDRELAAALPGTVAAGRLIRAFYNGRTADIPVRDKGPWNTNDSYWASNSRPQAETCFHAKQPLPSGPNAGRMPNNPAGIDLTPAAWKALGYSGNARDAQDKIDWDFVDVLDGQAGVSTLPPTSPIPAHLVLMRSLVGIDAHSHSAAILGWAAAIGIKFPEMASYCSNYTDVSTPWCGLTVAYAMAVNGVKPQFGATDTDRFLWADSWRQFGTAVEKPQPGDVLVFKWAGGGHHVTLYDHEENDAYYHCTGGNQGSGHVVSTEAMPMANCVAIRRP